MIQPSAVQTSAAPEKFRVLWISAGGTISKQYDQVSATLLPSASWHETLGTRLRLPHSLVTFRQPVLKDSLDMTDDDRNLIVELINAESKSHDGVVVTHGTDSLHDTITYVTDRISAPPCPIVFTGAMTPLAIHGSDAVQNLGAAFLAVRVLSPGCHVVFHDRVFSDTEFFKDHASGTFTNR